MSYINNSVSYVDNTVSYINNTVIYRLLCDKDTFSSAESQVFLRRVAKKDWDADDTDDADISNINPCNPRHPRPNISPLRTGYSWF